MRIVITGGSRGLGRALVESCAADHDNQVVFTYCHHEDEAMTLAGRFQNVRAMKVDFCNHDSLDLFVKELEEMSVDVLINNAYAGSAQGIHFHKTAPDDYTQAFQCNIIPVIKVTQACVKGMRQRKFGKIINIITSSVIDVPPTGYSVYTATKAYIRQLSKSWSKELGRFNITSNCILPDYMQTDFEKMEDFQLEQLKQSHPLKQLLKPEDVVPVVYSIIQASQQLNGVDIPINAAQHII